MNRLPAALVLVALAVPGLAGCLSFLDEEADRGVQPAEQPAGFHDIEVQDVLQHAATISSFDETALSAVIYEPLTGQALPDGSAPAWPVVVFVHGWASTKESWQNVEFDGETGQRTDLLDRFARAGILTVAYDARGFGQSGGQSTAAGPAEMADLDAILDYVQANFPASDYVGVTGVSYGGAHAFLAWTDNPRITTVVPHYGWINLYDGLAPGNVPKMEWGGVLFTSGIVATGGQYSPTLQGWWMDMFSRADPTKLKEQMAQRSAEARMGAVDKPLLLCQGMQESLFPQIDRAWGAAPGFVRARVFEGGHGAFNSPCWDDTLAWFEFFLAGKDTGVADWPALRTSDAGGGRELSFQEFPAAATRGFYLRAPDLAEAAYSNSTFTVNQRGGSNPFTDPGGFTDITGGPNQAIPEQFRQDPGAVFFNSRPVTEAEVVFGAPTLTMHAANDTDRFQIVASLFHVTEGGRSRLISQGSYAVLSEADHANGTFEVPMTWVKATMRPGDSLTLKVGANEPSTYMPLMENYSVRFSGSSRLDVAFLE